MKGSSIVKVTIPFAALCVGGFFALQSFKPVALVAAVEMDTAVDAVSGTVQVLAAQQMQLRSDLPGRIVASTLEQGVLVKAGELLIQLDSGDLELEISGAKANLEAARENRSIGSTRKFELLGAKEKLVDTKRLVELGTMTAADVVAVERTVARLEDEIKRESVASNLKVETLENKLRSLERELERSSVYSPIDGTISRVYSYKGDLVSAGHPIAEIVSDEKIVEVKVSEENFTGLEVGQLATVNFLGYTNENFRGSVSKVIPVADSDTQRYTINLDVEIESERLHAGLTGEASITLGQREQVMVVPKNAVDGNDVYRVEQGVVNRVKIERGYESLTVVEIRSGLSEGDQVIVENIEMFRPGDNVKTELKN